MKPHQILDSYKSAVLLLVLLVVPALSGQTKSEQDKAEEILAKAADFYRNNPDMKIEFESSTFMLALDEWQKSTGTLLLGQGSRFRLELGDVLIASDSASLWKLNRRHKQLLVENMAETVAFHPSRILFSFLECQADSMKSTNQHWVLNLKPSGSLEEYATLKIHLKKSNYSPSMIETMDEAGNETRYIVGRMKPLKKQAAKAFRLEAPSGFELIDMRE